MIPISVLISTHRIEHKMTQRKLSDLVFCSIDTIYKIERGDLVPNKRTLKLIFIELELDHLVDEYIQYLEDRRWE